MKAIIAGSRECTNKEQIFAILDEMLKSFDITEVVCGMARGVDLIGKEWADLKGITVKKFPAEWDKYGRSAGPIRNKQMADYADGLFTFWDGDSRGTKNMIELGLTNLKVTVSFNLSK